jgi:hypothetical protein
MNFISNEKNSVFHDIFLINFMAKKETLIVKTASAAAKNAADPSALPFNRKHYTWMIGAIVLVLSGFVIMSMDKAEFGFGFLGITLGPIVTMSGFLVGLFGLLQKK